MNRIETLLQEVPRQLLIGGKWRDPLPSENASRPDFNVLNPATGCPLISIADGGKTDAQAALQAAVEAQPSWARSSPQERSDILYRAWETILRRQEDLALLMSLEMGKPLAESRGEVLYSAKYLRWYAEEAVRIHGYQSRHPDGRGQILVVKEPVGPTLLITPWNFPLAMGARKLGPALAAGCTTVFKPAQQTPLCSLMLAKIFQEVGLPDGVLNLITSTRAGEITEPLLRSGQIRKISFTGSTRVGSLLLKQAAEQVVRSSMELGGNAPFIVFDDADPDAAAQGAITAKMRNMGEACTAANRIYVQRGIAEAFTRKLAEKLAAMPLGGFEDPAATVGPLIDEAAVQKISALVEEAVAAGAHKQASAALPSRGFFYPPTLLTDIPAGCRILHEEIFGPVAPVVTFDDEEEVISLANNTDAGLAAYLFTSDLSRAHRVAGALQSGMVGINTGLVSEVAAPFGGVKTSGLGREGGPRGIDEYLNEKYISLSEA